ncbi:MAG: L-lactate dehydrogenase [Bacillota bacterium]
MRKPGGTKVAVIGVGLVGSTYAYTLMMKGLAAEIVLYDRNRNRAEGQALDLNHGMPFVSPLRIYAGSLADCADADLAVIAAGESQKPGQTRLDLLQANVAVTRQVVGGLASHGFAGLILMATNPVDVLAYAAWKFSQLPSARVLGSGTILDTARLRFLLGEHCGVDPRNIHAYVLGEHGDSELPAWSTARIAGLSIADFCAACTRPCPEPTWDDLFMAVRDAAQDIIERKGATYYAIALGLARITESIVRDQKSVLTVSTLVEDYLNLSDVYIGLPCVIGRDGVEKVIRPRLDQDETERLLASAATVRQAIESSGILG